MRALIIDDEKRARKTVKQITQLYAPQITIVGEANSVVSAVEAIESHQPDLVFLDIQLGDGNGFDVLMKHPQRSFEVIFITAYDQYALQAFKVSAIDYLLKPIDPEDFLKALGKIKQQTNRVKMEQRMDLFLQQFDARNQAPEKITLKTMDHIYIVKIADIIYCNGEKNYTTFYLTENKKVMVSKNLLEYEELLPSTNFMRTHQSFLVNLDHIIQYDKGMQNSLICTEKHCVPVSTRKREQLMDYLKSL